MALEKHRQLLCSCDRTPPVLLPQCAKRFLPHSHISKEILMKNSFGELRFVSVSARFASSWSLVDRHRGYLSWWRHGLPGGSMRLSIKSAKSSPAGSRPISETRTRGFTTPCLQLEIEIGLDHGFQFTWRRTWKDDIDFKIYSTASPAFRWAVRFICHLQSLSFVDGVWA